MYYKFYVETLELINNSPHHAIVKNASSRTEAMMQILNDAIALGFTIDKIEFVGQYFIEPLCNTSFRGYKP